MPFHSGQSIVAVEFTAPEDNVRFFDVRPDRWISLVFILSFFYESLLGRYGVSSPSQAVIKKNEPTRSNHIGFDGCWG